MYRPGLGDIVTRKSYGGDVYFRIADISTKSSGKKSYLLRGLFYRIIADSEENDLQLQDPMRVNRELRKSFAESRIYHEQRNFVPLNRLVRVRGRSGIILHIDSSSEFLEMCRSYYRGTNTKFYGKVIPESDQPGSIRPLLTSTKADILVVTGHDGMKKNAVKPNSLDNYKNSRYYIRSATEARKYEPDFNKLCIFSGACQSYYEGIMEAGANFASSPGRILIHALDPAKVGNRVALTDSRAYVTQEQIARITKSGLKGIGSIRTRGHYII